MRTAGDYVFSDRIIDIFKGCSCIQWYVGFGEKEVLSKSIAGEKNFIKLGSIERGIIRKCYGIEQRVL